MDIIDTRIQEEKIKEDSVFVSKFLEESSELIETLFKRGQIEDDRKILADIHLLEDEFFEMDNEKLLSQDVKKSFDLCLKNLKIVCGFNVNRYGKYEYRKPIKNSFENKEVIKYPRGINDYKNMVRDIEFKRDEDSSIEFLDKTVFIIELITAYKNIIEEHENECDELIKKCKKVLTYNIGLFGRYDQRLNSTAPNIQND